MPKRTLEVQSLRDMAETMGWEMALFNMTVDAKNATHLPSKIVELLAKHPNVAHQIEVTRGKICEDAAVEIVKGDGQSVVVQFKDLEYRNQALLQTLAAAVKENMDGRLYCTDPGDFSSTWLHLCPGYGSGIDPAQELLESWEIEYDIDTDPRGNEDSVWRGLLTSEEQDRMSNWFQRSQESRDMAEFCGEDEEDWIYYKKQELVAQYLECADGNGFDAAWFNRLVETAKTRAAEDAWVPPPVVQYTFCWI